LHLVGKVEELKRVVTASDLAKFVDPQEVDHA
jgi:hypothetical protein